MSRPKGVANLWPVGNFAPMKSRFRLTPAFLLTFLLAAALWAQTAPDVSRYPDPASLPGKGPTNVWNGLSKVWAQRHQMWAGHAAADHGAVVFLGDSITQGFEPLTNYFPGMKVANRGIGGDTTRGVLYRMDADVLDLDPEGIVLLIGTNDLGIGADPADVLDNIKAILARLKAHNPHTPVVVCAVMPRSDGHLNRSEKIRQLNAGIAETIKGDPQFTLCDTWSLYADANGDCSPSEFRDLLHPNKVGYEKWAAALQPIFARLNFASHP
jgi:lysophospholipase L1-like esterase